MMLKCLKCGKEFKSDRKNQKYCNMKCYSETKKGIEPEWLRKNRGKKPKNRKISKCHVCKKKFEHWAGREAKYCGRKCWKRRNPKLKYYCNVCGKIFYDWNKNRRFCSRKCYFKFKKLTGIGNNMNFGKWVKSNGKPKNAFVWGKGKKHHNWKGGVTSFNEKIRKSRKYKGWVKKVFKRDDYACVNCGVVGFLHADHILPFAYFPKLRFDIKNGRTLCKECHNLLPNGRELKIMFEFDKITSKHYISIAEKRLQPYLEQRKL